MHINVWTYVYYIYKEYLSSLERLLWNNFHIWGREKPRHLQSYILLTEAGDIISLLLIALGCEKQLFLPGNQVMKNRKNKNQESFNSLLLSLYKLM